MGLTLAILCDLEYLFIFSYKVKSLEGPCYMVHIDVKIRQSIKSIWTFVHLLWGNERKITNMTSFCFAFSLLRIYRLINCFCLHSAAKQQISCNLPLVALHHFCLTKGFPKTPHYSAIWRYFTLIRLCLALLFVISVS